MAELRARLPCLAGWMCCWLSVDSPVLAWLAGSLAWLVVSHITSLVCSQCGFYWPWGSLFNVIFHGSLFPFWFIYILCLLLLWHCYFFILIYILTFDQKKKKELSVCQSLLCLDLVSFPVLSQIKPQAPLLVVPFRQFL